jgi:aryl-alcohol dehydrogenase-like predicted oxidoreductase
MENRQLGHSSLSVPALGLGCMSMSGTYGKHDDAQSIDVIHHALDLGVNFLDSSDMYGFGHNEELLGRAIRGKRNQFVVTTKFGQVRTPEGRMTVNGRPDYVLQACDASLKRLGIDVVDLYYQHRVDPTVPIEDTVGAMKRLIEQGKVRYIGLCEAAPETVRRAHRVHPLSALQSEFSLLYRVEAEGILPTLRELGISFVAYSPLGRSWLTGRVENLADIPVRRSAPRSPALPGGQLREKPRAGPADRAGREGKGLHTGAAGARVAPGARPGHRADSGHEAEGAARREREGHRGSARRA